MTQSIIERPGLMSPAQERRSATAALLALVLMLSGLFAGLERASHGAARMFSGIVLQLCGDPPGNNPGSGAAGGHDCCDLCVLGAPAILAGVPEVSVPIADGEQRSTAVRGASTPTLARIRTPRQSQGPPAG